MVAWYIDVNWINLFAVQAIEQTPGAEAPKSFARIVFLSILPLLFFSHCTVNDDQVQLVLLELDLTSFVQYTGQTSFYGFLLCVLRTQEILLKWLHLLSILFFVPSVCRIAIGSVTRMTFLDKVIMNPCSCKYCQLLRWQDSGLLMSADVLEQIFSIQAYCIGIRVNNSHSLFPSLLATTIAHHYTYLSLYLYNLSPCNQPITTCEL